MTLHLRTLGQIHLRDDADVELRSLLTQPKRLALLVYLAANRGDGRMCRRDTLMAMFWPESDDERARGALRQSIHFIKQVAGSDVVISRGADEIGLAAGAISLDAAELDRLAAEGRHAEAVALYEGEFLDGFFVRGVPAFERWVEAERARLTKRAADSAWLASEQCIAGGDAAAGREMGARALALSANNETAVRRFIALLSQGGDRAAAMAVYQSFSAQMAQEYGVAPSPETRALLADLETATLASPTEPIVVVPPAAPGPTNAVGAVRKRRRIAAAAAAAVVIAVVAAGVAVRQPLFGRVDEPSDPNRMVVLPFVVRGPQSMHYLEDGLPILLGTRLDGAGSLRTVDARALIVHLGEDRKGAPIDAERAVSVASRFGAQLYVLGSIVATGDSLRFSASLYDRTHGTTPLAHAEADGTEADLLHLVDRLASELLAARFREAGGSIAETAARTTASLPALKAWLAGEAAITAGRYAAAIGPLREAIAADSNFAMAHFRLAVAANWSAMPRVVDEEAKRAVALSDRMSPSTRLVLQAFLDMRTGAYTHAAQVLRTVLVEQPSATEAWYEMGEVLFHGNPPQGRPLSAARDAFESALRLDPHNFSAAIHLARIAAARGDAAALDRLSKAALDSNPDVAQRSEIFLLRALALHDGAARAQFLAQPPELELLDALWRDTEYSGNLADASAIADSLLRVAPTAEMKASLQLFLASVAMGRERFDDALRNIDAAAAHAPQSAAVIRLLLATHPALPGAQRASLVRRALAGGVPLPASSSARKVYFGATYADSVSEYYTHALARAKLLAGDSSLARRLGALRIGASTSRMLQTTMMLTLANDHAGRAAALRQAESVDSLFGAVFTAQSVFGPRAIYHFAVARALDDEGRPADALARLDALPEDFGFNIGYTAELLRRRAALLAKVGRQADAQVALHAAREVVK